MTTTTQISVNRSRPLSTYIGWDLCSMNFEYLKGLGEYQDYCKSLPSDFSNTKLENAYWNAYFKPKTEKVRYVYCPTNPERELVLTEASKRIANFDFNKRDIAGTQPVRKSYGDNWTQVPIEGSDTMDVVNDAPTVPIAREKLLPRKGATFQQLWIRHHRLDSTFVPMERKERRVLKEVGSTSN